MIRLTSSTEFMMRCYLWLRKCWHWFWDCRMSDKNSQQDKGKGVLEGWAINDNNNICFAVHKSSTFSWNLIPRCSKKRNILDEGRMFNDEWFMKYFVGQQNGRPLCFICQNEIACLKKFNMKRHYNSSHSVKYEGSLGRCRWIKPISWRSHCKGQQKMISLCKNDKQLGLNWASTLVKQ